MEMHGPNGAGTSVSFSVVAPAEQGTTVRAVGSIDALGRWLPERGAEMRREGSDSRWSATLRIPGGFEAVNGIEYKFVKVFQDRSVAWEDGQNRRMSSADLQRSGAPPAQFGQQNSQAVGARILALPVPVAPSTASTVSAAPPPNLAAGETEMRWEVTCTTTQPGDRLLLVGSHPALGDWCLAKGLELTTSGDLWPRWTAKANLRLGISPLEWKMAIQRAGSGHDDWEHVANRRLARQAGEDCRQWVVRADFGDEGALMEPLVAPKSAASTPSTSTPSKPPAVKPTTSPSAPSVEASISPVAAPAIAAIQPQTGRSRVESTLGDLPTLPRRDPAKSGATLLSNNDKSHRRTSSFSMLGDLLLTSNKTRDGLQASEQQLVLRLEDVPADDAARYVVEAVFETDGGSRSRLALEDAPTASCQEARWSLTLAEGRLRSGVHTFHFLVNGVRVLSADHPVLDSSNALMVSEAIRKYVASRDCDHDAGASTGVGSFATQTAPPGSLSRGGNPQSGNAVTEDDLRPSDRQGGMARPYSVANLVGLCDDDSEPDPQETSHKAPTFGKEVFEGLFDGELRLRVDGFVLPEVPILDSASSDRPSLRLEAGAAMLKKQVGACEDAYFKGTHGLGVADGVGCMVQFASYGINAAAYAAELMATADKALQPGGAAAVGKVEDRARKALAEAEERAQAYGASTISVMCMQDNIVGVANLGDSGYMQLRKAAHGWQIVGKSEEQQHSWNCPYQLTRLPPALLSRFPKLSLDTAADSQSYQFEVCEGDLLLMFTDGLHDNLHEREIVHIVECALSPIFGELMGLAEHATPADRLARALALAAKERSLDPVARVPFVEYSKRHGYECQGGKQDDITVVAAWVVSDARPVPRVPADAKASVPPPQEPQAPEPVEVVDALDGDSCGGGGKHDASKPADAGGASAARSGAKPQFETQAARPAATNGSAWKLQGGSRAEFNPMSSAKGQASPPAETTNGGGRRRQRR